MTKLYDDDASLFALMKTRLFTAVVGDVLDQMGLMRQFLPAGIAPLDPSHVIAGRAMPVLEADVFGTADGAAGPLTAKPFGLMLEALDNLRAGEVYIAAGASMNYALWGELMSARAIHLGAAGAVLDGYIRDSRGIRALGFPAFGRGVYAQDQGPRGKVIDFRCGLEIGGVAIQPGDLIFGDAEGVLVIPREAEAEAIRRALEKAETEGEVEKAIRSGMSAVDAMNTFGVM
ncbi:RraA family protein [Paracoccus zhejiangensis]|uniref:Putative 4-hydroxy-4-methyl-2-oxoglutarate aldolase n=1 Tax=Paracoccus zhejiangensis TaxID=1077935 RepID=A0A2H5F4M8_9RHOB|nr:RraA family protein [Paracoccus zhejiangensis]AUH66508.1 dimethylmenaquinone methyltransferase [Paracoccus zhejiangensis]